MGSGSSASFQFRLPAAWQGRLDLGRSGCGIAGLVQGRGARHVRACHRGTAEGGEAGRWESRQDADPRVIRSMSAPKFEALERVSSVSARQVAAAPLRQAVEVGQRRDRDHLRVCGRDDVVAVKAGEFPAATA